jgi:hypothetical protein
MIDRSATGRKSWRRSTWAFLISTGLTVVFLVAWQVVPGNWGDRLALVVLGWFLVALPLYFIFAPVPGVGPGFWTRRRRLTRAWFVWTGLAALAVVLAAANPFVICDTACVDVRSAVVIDFLSFWLVGALALALARWIRRQPGPVHPGP